MLRKDKHTSNGFTLIEVIISISILAILLGGAYMFLGFGSKIFSKGTKQYDIQANIRLAEDYITKQVRFATDVKILDDLPTDLMLDSHNNYIYFDSSNNSITHINKNFTKKIKLGDRGSLEFKSIKPYYELSFIITAEEKQQKYSIEDKLDPMNMKYGAEKLIEGAELESEAVKIGQVIRFKTASEYLEDNSITKW